MRLNKNKILITGATAGIGKALIGKFLELDNQIIAVGRNEKRLEELSKSDKRVIPFKCDITKQDELDELTVFIEQQHSDLNILINNAGIQYNYHFSDEPQLLHKIEYEINANFLAPLRLIALMLPTLLAIPETFGHHSGSSSDTIPEVLRTPFREFFGHYSGGFSDT